MTQSIGYYKELIDLQDVNGVEAQIQQFAHIRNRTTSQWGSIFFHFIIERIKKLLSICISRLTLNLRVYIFTEEDEPFNQNAVNSMFCHRVPFLTRLLLFII